MNRKNNFYWAEEEKKKPEIKARSEKLERKENRKAEIRKSRNVKKKKSKEG